MNNLDNENNENMHSQEMIAKKCIKKIQKADNFADLNFHFENATKLFTDDEIAEKGFREILEKYEEQRNKLQEAIFSGFMRAIKRYDGTELADDILPKATKAVQKGQLDAIKHLIPISDAIKKENLQT